MTSESQQNFAIVLEDIHEVECGLLAKRGDCVEWYGEGSLCSVDAKKMPAEKGVAPRYILCKQRNDMAPTFLAPLGSVVGPFDQEEVKKLFIILAPADMVTMLNPMTGERYVAPRTVIRDQGNVSHKEIKTALLTFEEGIWKRYHN